MHKLIPTHNIMNAVECVTAEGCEENKNIEPGLTSVRDSAYVFFRSKDKSYKSYGKAGKGVEDQVEHRHAELGTELLIFDDNGNYHHNSQQPP